MASSSAIELTGSYSCLGYQIPIILGHDEEFKTLILAYEGHHKTSYDQGLTASTWEPRDVFLKLVRKKIPGINVSVIFSTLDKAIRIFQSSSYITSRDYDLLKKLVGLVYTYNLICERQWGRLLDEISIRQKDKRGQETQELAERLQREERAKQAAKEEQESRKRKREEEALFEEEAIKAGVEAEERTETSPSEASPSAAPSSDQSLFVIAGSDPTARPRRGGPQTSTPPPRHTQQIKVSSEELELILATKKSLDNKTKVNWPAHKGSREHDRLGPEAVLDLAETVVEGETGPYLPGAVVVPSTKLPDFTYISFRKFHDKNEENPTASWHGPGQ